ncbi:MAG: adenosylcobinamide-GDP ribazoletransferase [Oscillospiraceae bacterium]|nr:adenosylcobinamide-GDP ribazoletransferase [Oscillospiraceae bacterium]
MFSAIPMPRTPWNQQMSRYMLCAFPLVGVVIGLCWLAWDYVCHWLSLPAILRGAGCTLLPVALTGGIHLDGYADTADALCSHATPERKREILKDPCSGAFAVIWLCTYFLATFALCASLEASAVMVPAFVLSRALSGAALTLLPLADGYGLARTFVEASDLRRVRVILGAECLAAALTLWICGGGAGVLMTCAAAAVLLRYVHVAKCEFGGASGDLAGWFLQKAEFWMLAALVLAQYWEANA